MWNPRGATSSADCCILSQHLLMTLVMVHKLARCKPIELLLRTNPYTGASTTSAQDGVAIAAASLAPFLERDGPQLLVRAGVHSHKAPV